MKLALTETQHRTWSPINTAFSLIHPAVAPAAGAQKSRLDCKESEVEIFFLDSIYLWQLLLLCKTPKLQRKEES